LLPSASKAQSVTRARSVPSSRSAAASEKAQSPPLGLAVIVPFLALILLTIRAFNVVDPFASWLLWPYAGWVSFATLINIAIYALNR
jgi:tryptophan-rich sensory protein